MFIKIFITVLIVSCMVYTFIFYTFSNVLPTENIKNFKNSTIQSIIGTKKILITEFLNTTQYNRKNIDSIKNQWEELNGFAYFKRSAAFYFVKTGFLTVLFIANSEQIYEIYIEAYINNQRHKLFLNKTRVKVNRKTNTTFYWLDVYIEENKFAEILAESNKVNIYIKDEYNSTTLNPIEVKIKQSYKKKSGNLICTKCFYLKRNELMDLMWWIELNKQIGYDKIILCNNSIPFDTNFDQFLQKHQSFVEIVSLKNFPYFHKKTVIYMKKISEILNYLEDKQKYIYSRHKNPYETLQYNECYLDNKEKYKYITIIDIDEIIMPSTEIQTYSKRIDSIECDQINCLKKLPKNCEVNINQYTESLDKQNQGITFKITFYISDEIIQKLFFEIDMILSNSSIAKNNNSITINDSKNSFNYTFTFETKNDYKYVKKLIKIYKSLIREEIIDKKFNELNKSSLFINRLFYFFNDKLIQYNPKTVHNTDSTYLVANHRALVPKKSYIVPIQMGHLSHFRINYADSFKERKISEIPINDIYLDLDYLSCYYPQVLKNINRIN